MLGEKLAPFPALFVGKKKMFAKNFFSYIHVKNKEGITVAEKYGAPKYYGAPNGFLLFRVVICI